MEPILDWSSYQEAGLGDAYADIPKYGGDFAKAVAVCINSRQCEKEDKGLMCPSYRVTQNPQLSTGGRIRLIKSILNSEQVGERLQDDDLVDAMALCVGCKGCKRECENGVDMAMIKIETLAQRHRRQSPSLRNRLLGSLSLNLYRHRFLKTLLHWRNRSRLLAKLGESLFGISAKRMLPEPVNKSYVKRDSTGVHEGTAEVQGEVVLLIDTFTNNFSPENAEAAVAVLEHAGYRVFCTLPTTVTPEPDRPLCCGRTHLANGMIEDATHEAQRMLSVLLPHVDAGRQIVGLEPSCLLAIRDDYKFLGLGEAALKVADKAILFEEFIAREISAKRFKPRFKPVDTHGEPLLVHGHCHQKAVGAMKSMRKVLKAIPELQFSLIDSSCCGMAGSFGVEREHADIAMQMAELSLLPALREKPQARILANGFSCRHQIQEGTARPSIHLARLLQEAIV